MFAIWNLPGLKKFFRAHGEPCPVRGRVPRVPRVRPLLEALEDRAVPSTATWDGSGTTNNWSDRFNWVRNGVVDAAPQAGDDLVFPSPAARLANVNNFSGVTAFNSITFSGTMYNISSASGSVLNLGAGGIRSTLSTAFNSYNGAIQLDGSRTIEVAGGLLTLGGSLSGSGGISKTGTGALKFAGLDANTYTGLTEVFDGRLELSKGDTAVGGRIAIAGNLEIHSSFNSTCEVRLNRDNEIADDATVTISHLAKSSPRPVLNLNGFSDTIGPLKMTGGLVETNKLSNTSVLGVLTLNGDVTAQASITGLSSFDEAEINGTLALGVTRTITVNRLSGTELGLDLVLAGTTGGTLTKQGAGRLVLGSATISTVQANAGTVQVRGILRGSVSIRNDALLTGDGEVRGSISADGGEVHTLDDGSPGFTTTTGWSTITGQGFNDDVTSTSAVSTGTGRTATWTFTGLKPGVYRVFATWTTGTDHTPKALYNIFDDSKAVSAPIIDQVPASKGGPKDGGVVFQQLGEPVSIKSNILKVELSTKFGGGVYVADAIRIERLAGTLTPDGVFTETAGSVTLGAGSTYRVDLFSDGTHSSADVLEMAGAFTSSGALLAITSSSFTAPAPGTAFRIITPGSFTGAFSNLPTPGDPIVLDAGGQKHTFTINYANSGVDLIYQNTATQVRDLKISPDVIKQGNRVTLHGALTDPNAGDVLSLRIDWGDGSGAQTYTDLGTKPFHFSHIYAEPSQPGSPYAVQVEWFDQHGTGNSATFFVTVKEDDGDSGATSSQVEVLTRPDADLIWALLGLQGEQDRRK